MLDPIRLIYLFYGFCGSIVCIGAVSFLLMAYLCSQFSSSREHNERIADDERR